MDERGRARRRSRKSPRVVHERTPYEILGVPQTATFADVRKAYLAMVRLSPPERDPEGFKSIQKAYSSLKDAARRKALDLSTFRKELAAGATVEAQFDAAALFRERMFQLLLASSDLYLRDFSRFFAPMDEEARRLS